VTALSIFDVFKIGIGPSSSHTVGPMKAALAFAEQLEVFGSSVTSIQVTLYGSLAFTGKGHGTDSAILLGLMGLQPDTIDPDSVEEILRAIHGEKKLDVLNIGRIAFDPETDLVFDYGKELPRHTNGMRFVALSESAECLADENYYSLGGGFIAKNDDPEPAQQDGAPLFRFDSGESLLAQAQANGLSIAELVFQNEVQWRSADDIEQRIKALWSAMESCIERGLRTEGVLPGTMSVLRRAAKLRRRLEERKEQILFPEIVVLDYF
jgi:L-serine dehydratase